MATRETPEECLGPERLPPGLPVSDAVVPHFEGPFPTPPAGYADGMTFASRGRTEACKTCRPGGRVMSERPESILSHGERDVAGYVRDGVEPAEIAAARGVSEESVRKAIDRLEEKTRRAAVTLVESPLTDEIARELDDETREALLVALRAPDE